MKKKWKDIKGMGSKHYQGSDVQLIDLWRRMKPHPSLTVLDIFALCDNMKYSYRQLTEGVCDEDCDKIHHYTDMCEREDK